MLVRSCFSITLIKCLKRSQVSGAEPPMDSEFLSFLCFISRILAEILSLFINAYMCLIVSLERGHQCSLCMTGVVLHFLYTSCCNHPSFQPCLNVTLESQHNTQPNISKYEQIWKNMKNTQNKQSMQNTLNAQICKIPKTGGCPRMLYVLIRIFDHLWRARIFGMHPDRFAILIRFLGRLYETRGFILNKGR